MHIENAFEVPVPVAEAWSLLTDIEGIAPCMPGAELTEILDDGAYKGKVSVRLGPVTLAFNGTARFVDSDEANRRARVTAQGSDTKGRGGASADITFRLEPLDHRSRVVIQTDLTLSGSVAQYGRGAGMISELANQLVGQFADCLSEKIAARPAAGAPPETTEAGPAQAAPVPMLGLLARSFWAALVRALRRLLGRS